jgi:hypothetical protein
MLTSDSRRLECAEMLELLKPWQILSLSLEHLLKHLSGIGPATNEGIVQEGVERYSLSRKG